MTWADLPLWWSDGPSRVALAPPTQSWSQPRESGGASPVITAWPTTRSHFGNGVSVRTRNSEQEDYLLRMIQQLRLALARLREMLGGAAPGAAVRVEVAQNVALLLGADSAMLDQLDAESASRLVGSSARIEIWAQLLELEAELWARDGAVEREAALTARAVALRTAAARLTE